MIAYSKAELLLRERLEYDDGTLVEMAIWKLPVPVRGSGHEYKYRLFYGRTGERLVGYGNERTKGDHRHVSGRGAYVFTDVESLVRDFLIDIERMRSK